MRIAFVTPYFHPASQYGGTPRAAFELARALVSRGHHVKVLTTDSAGESRLPPAVVQSREVEGIEVHYYRNVSNYLAHRHRIFYAPRFRAELRKQLSDCDVLHIHEFRSTLIVPAVRVARQISLPYVLSPHGGLSHLGKHAAKALFDRLWGRSILAEAATIVVLTKKEEAEAVSFQVAPSRIRHLPNAIQPSDYTVLPASGLFRRRWNVAPGKIVLFLGRLHAVKGPDLLLEAFSLLRKEMPEVTLVLAGPDDGEGVNVRRIALKAGLEGRVLMTGFLDPSAKLEALVDCDLLVLPSRSEGSPVVVAEALLCDRPALVSSVCEFSTPDTGRYGILQFRTQDVEDLKQKLLFGLTDAQLRSNAVAGHQYVLGAFSPEAVAGKAEDIYRETLSFKDR